jgi:hypothetical protein
MDELSKSNVSAVLAEFFVLKDGSYRQPRMETELVKAKESYKRRASAALQRWEQERKKSNATAKQEQCNSNPCDSDSYSAVEVDSQEIGDLEKVVLRIGRLHPANAHRRESLLVLPPEQAQAIYQALQRHGEEAVIAGTRNYAEVVATWPAEGKARRVKSVRRFYEDSDYMRDPREWQEERTDGNRQPSTGETRSERSKSAILDGLAADNRRAASSDPLEREGRAVAGLKR